MYEHLPDRKIICVDMRSFYASCAAVMEGLDVMEHRLRLLAIKSGKAVSFSLQKADFLFAVKEEKEYKVIS